MSKTNNQETQLSLSYDITELSPAQVRLLRRIHATLADLITTDDEGDFFEGSADLMRICAHLIKQSHFTDIKKGDPIAYAEQAIEYSMDSLREHMERPHRHGIDN